MKYLVYISFILFLQACIMAPSFPDEPELSFDGFSKSVIKQGSINEDSLFIHFSFTDGDGDIGQRFEDRNETNFDVFVTDLRTGEILDKFYAPYIPPKGTTNGIQGTGRILLFTTCCLHDMAPELNPCDASSEFSSESISFEVYMKDRAGNESNRVMTTNVTLLCN